MTALPKIVLVTGPGSGIGRAVAVALLQSNYHVVLSGRRAEALHAPYTATKHAITGLTKSNRPRSMADHSTLRVARSKLAARIPTRRKK